MIQWLIRAACPKPVQSPEPLPSSVVVRYAGWLPAIAGVLSGMKGPAAAVTIGRTIIVHPNVHVTAPLVRHELAHVKQWEEDRWLFPLRYAINHLRYGYHDNPYEIDARAAETNQGPA